MVDVTDQMVEAAAATLFHAEHYTPDVLRNALRAALAAMPSEWNAAIEAAATKAEELINHADDGEIYVIRKAIDAIRQLRRPA